MKIAILSVFHPFRGGIAQFNESLFFALKEHADVKAFSFTTQYPEFLFPGKSQFVDKNDSDQGICAERVLSSINPISFITTANKINSFQPDVLIVPFWMPFFAPSLGSVLRLINSKTIKIGLIHNAIPHEKRKGDKALSKYFFKATDGMVVLSDTVEKDLKSWHQSEFILKRSHPIYSQFGPKSDMNQAKLQLGIPVDRKVILFFGFIRKYKGLDILIDALSKSDLNYHLLIAGECYGDFSEYETKLKQLEDSRVTKLTRYIANDEVATIFSASDICALPYRSATQSGIASIAKYYQVPMVVTPVGELPNELVHEKTGIVAQNISSAAFLDALNKAFPSLQTFQSNLVLELNENSWEKFALSFFEFISTIQKSKKR